MAHEYLISGGGNWSNGAVWYTGTVPTAADDVFSNNFTVNVDVSFTVLSLRSTAASPIVAGGSFLFNTAGVTGTVTSSSPLVPGATNMVQITATTGTVTLSLGGNVTPRNVASDILINHSGNCNLNITGTAFTGGGQVNSAVCISKTSTGTITITGNITGGSGGTGNNFNYGLISTAGNTIVIGNVAGSPSQLSNTGGIIQQGGNLTVTGSVNGGASTSGNNNGILFSGNILTVSGSVNGGNGSTTNYGINVSSVLSTTIINGNVAGGTLAAGILTISQTTINGNVTGTLSLGLSTSAPINNIIGNVTGGTVAAISSTSANIINVTGTVTASASSPAISMTNANGQVYLNGNMVNNNGKMAIFAPIVWLDTTGTTSAAFFTSGGVARTLYSADTVPNQPAQNNVRFNTVYGPGNSLTGTCVMPVAANSRNGVVYDNGTVGTALFTTSLFLTELSASTVPVAVRMQNLCTPQILGELMEAYKR